MVARGRVVVPGRVVRLVRVERAQVLVRALRPTLLRDHLDLVLVDHGRDAHDDVREEDDFGEEERDGEDEEEVEAPADDSRPSVVARVVARLPDVLRHDVGPDGVHAEEQQRLDDAQQHVLEVVVRLRFRHGELAARGALEPRPPHAVLVAVDALVERQRDVERHEHGDAHEGREVDDPLAQKLRPRERRVDDEQKDDEDPRRRLDLDELHDERVEVHPEIEREVEIVVELRRLRAVREAVLAAVRRDRVEPDPLHEGLGGKRTYAKRLQYACVCTTSFLSCLKGARREKTIRPKIGRNDFDVTELEKFRWTRPFHRLFPARTKASRSIL